MVGEGVAVGALGDRRSGARMGLNIRAHPSHPRRSVCRLIKISVINTVLTANPVNLVNPVFWRQTPCDFLPLLIY